MNGAGRDIDAQRERWHRYRALQHLVLEAEDDFARGGLGSTVSELDVRVLVLPSDPMADVVSLDHDAQEWFVADRASPYGGAPPDWGPNVRASANAIVRHAHERDDGAWNHYLALHRHAGIEAGWSGMSWMASQGGLRFFALRPIVALTWFVAVLEREAQDRWSVAGPFELSVALRETRGTGLAHFAEGWRDPSRDFAYGDVRTCLDAHVLLRLELDEPFDPAQVALAVGDRVENSFGTTDRRHIAHRGDYEGRFDPRFRL